MNSNSRALARVPQCSSHRLVVPTCLESMSCHYGGDSHTAVFLTSPGAGSQLVPTHGSSPMCGGLCSLEGSTRPWLPQTTHAGGWSDDGT